MAAGHVYHWKHGWIPLTHFAALQKAHGSQAGAARYLHASHEVHGSESPGHYIGGVALSPESAKTQATLKQKGLRLGSTVYWMHPGTGRQTKAKIVGIEQSGHIIVEHSGNRNALIGHTTYSVKPHEDVPFQAPFRNPHSHTVVVEQDEHGNPIGYRPRAASAPRTTGRTVIERNFPPKNIDAKPDLTPTPSGVSRPLPSEFKQVDPRAALADAHVTTVSRNYEASKIKQAYQLGHHKVFIQAQLTKDQTRGLLHDIKETLHQAHPTVGDKPVTFLVPTGDRIFRSQRNGGTVMGYVVRGGSTININPKVASGEYKAEQAAKDGFLAPASKGASTRRYTITHELGHVVDNFHSRSHEHGMFHEGVSHFQDTRGQLSKYAATSISEGYAEAFAQHQLGGVHHGNQHKIAEEYARIYGWKKAK
jgi:hypothetical protein